MRKLSVVFIALAMVFAFSVNAMAAQALFYTEKERLPTAPTKEIEIYGSVRLQTFIQDFSADGVITPTNRDDTDLVWSLDDGSSRFGVRFKSGKVGANVEIRPRDQQPTDPAYGSFGRTTLLRHWYGSYDLGFGNLIVGYTWTPTFNPICNECLVGGGGILDGYGDMGGSTRKAGLQLHMPVKMVNGLLKVALLEPTTRSNAGSGRVNADGTVVAAGVPAVTVVGGGFTDTDTTLPAIEASFAGAFGPLRFTVRGGWNTFDLEDPATNASESIDSFLAALDLTYSMGPFYVRGLGYVGQNLASFGSHAPSSVGTFGFLPTLTNVGGVATIEDTDNFGFFAVAGFKFNDMISVEAGWGTRTAEQDALGVTSEDTKSAFVVFVPISITPAFVITPEVLFADEGEIERGGVVVADRGSTLRYGIYWRIDF